MDISSHAGGELETTLQPMRSFGGVSTYIHLCLYSLIADADLLEDPLFLVFHLFHLFHLFPPVSPSNCHATPCRLSTMGPAQRSAGPRKVPGWSRTRPTHGRQTDGVKVRSWGAHATVYDDNWLNS